MKTRSGRNASQRADELLPFIDILRTGGTRSYLEIGARHGDTFFDVVRSLPKGSKAVALDLAGGKWGTPKSAPALKAAVAELRSIGYDASIVWGDSRNLGTLQNVMASGPYDAILIDGDHTYDGVSADWRNYGRMGRIVAFHDIAGDGMTTKDGLHPVEVPALWSEIKHEFRHKEIIGSDSKMGIGVLWRA